MGREYLNLNELISDVTKKVTENRSEKEKESFRRYFEDIILYEAVASTKIVIKNGENYPTPNVRSSLVASNIDRDGKLDQDVVLNETSRYLRFQDYMYAKSKIKKLDEEYLNGSLKDVVAEAKAEVESHKEIINPEILVKIGTAIKDRICGYYETRNDLSEMTYVEEAKKIWQTEKAKYIESNLEDTPYYQILRGLFDDPTQHHYPLASKEALAKISSYTYKLDYDEEVSIEGIKEIYRLNDASALLDIDIFEEYGEEIKACMLAYTKRHDVKDKEKTKQ